MTSRPLAASDFQMLRDALDQDKYDHDSPLDYAEDGTESVVYEDGHGPIAVFRYSKELTTLRISAVWCDNADRMRNAKVAIKFFNDTLAKATVHGFKELIFNTESPSLAAFCTERLGFEKRGSEYVRNVGV